MLRHSVAEQSGHDTITTEQNTLAGISRLAAEYDTIANAAQHDRWADLIHASALTIEQAKAVVDSSAFGILSASLRRAEGNGHLVEQVLPRLIDARPLDGVADPAAVLASRLDESRHGPAGIGSRTAAVSSASSLPPADP